ncbi:uncharacterized protein LOC124917771, partial [Impatiens glandulifera]|uniref:uncharacterized protein LOC124917771 n=1 Tax=Impatiens glandulifera TaxID=253017 RepID=UPI001FB0B59D
GRKKKTAKKAAPAKAKAEGKGKEQVIFSEPPQHTEDEEWASERTDIEKTEDNRTVNEDGSAQSPNDAAPNTNPKTTEGGEEVDKEADDEGDDTEREEAEEAEADRIAGKLLQGIRRRAESVEELYLEWHEHRFDTPYRQILPGHTDEQCINRPKEVEDLMMNITNSNTLQEDRSNRIVDSALKFADVTRHLLERNQERFSELGESLQEEVVQRDKCVQRTAILEDVTSDLKKDFDRLERETDQRLTSMSNDLVGTTLDRVSKLEKTNKNLVAELKALSEQMAEILRAKVNADAAAIAADAETAKRIQDALDAEAGKDKEAPRSSKLTEEEEEAARIKKAKAIFPGFAEKVVTQAAEDAARWKGKNGNWKNSPKKTEEEGGRLRLSAEKAEEGGS